MTTTDPANSFIQNGNLIIKPTLQDPSLITTNNILNLQSAGCTGSNYYSCVVATNITNGTIVNPVKSARLNTKKGASIKYGRVEVTAKLPVGDWLWPAIWMLPTQSVYGEWPASGEIDIMESRGNNLTYPNGGNNVAHQTTHWGPDGTMDQAFWTTAGSRALHATYAGGFHTYGLQWTEKYLFTCKSLPRSLPDLPHPPPNNQQPTTNTQYPITTKLTTPRHRRPRPPNPLPRLQQKAPLVPRPLPQRLRQRLPGAGSLGECDKGGAV